MRLDIGQPFPKILFLSNVDGIFLHGTIFKMGLAAYI